MTEDVKIRVTADADQLVSELTGATRALRGMAATAQRTASSTNASVKSIELQTLGRNVLEVAEKVGRMASAFYGAATAWRDSMKELEQTQGLESMIGGVDSAEESVRRIKDSFSALAATLLSEFAPAIEVAAGKVRDFTVGAAFVVERVSLALTYLTQGEEAAFRQFQETQGQLEALSVSLLRSTEGQIEAQERATRSTERQTKALKEQRDIVADFEAAWRRSAEASSAAAIAADIATSATLKQADAESRAKLQGAAEAAQQARDAEIEAAQQANAQRVAQRQQTDALVIDSAVQTAQTLAGLVKQGSAEAAVAQKAAALFAVTINTIQGASKAIAELGPLGFPAAAAIGALGAAQAAAIASAPMPSYDRGGIVEGGPQYPGGTPGQVLVQAEKGEGFFTKRQMEAMGQQGPQTIILKVGSREFSRAVIDSGATDGLQRRRGVGQRRYGG